MKNRKAWKWIVPAGLAALALAILALAGGLAAQTASPAAQTGGLAAQTGSLATQAGGSATTARPAGAPSQPAQPAVASGVRMWEESVVIPTYLIGDPEPNPMFYFGRNSQGAQGRVYPYPLYDTLTNKKVDKTYTMVYLENEYVRIGVLPEVGGRLFEGLDKTNQYNFIYRQHVIKPALIGLIGAWISGGIEWNIPHHHRATSALPVQYKLEENPDGSKTVWVGELEVRGRMRWAVGYTLRPGKAMLEASVRILNRTPVAQTMLSFANVAVHVNENYQVIFPPSTQYGTYHNKNQFTKWPIATGRYAGADFSQGVDVSWYKNHISSNSIFAWNYQDDFLAGYDHGKEAGTLSVADHHMVPGKKLWTWGNGPRGRTWDHILTDDDGPYMELMVGAYSDNQPDYSWLQPYEVKSFKQYWYPFRNIGGVKNANLDAAVNLETAGGKAKVGFYTPSAHAAATVTLKAGDKVLLQEKVAIGPARPYSKEVGVPGGTDEHDLRASISAEGRELVAYSPLRLAPEPMPKAVTPPPPPQQIKTTEELYLAGLRIEQFHNASLDPLAYWQEALGRDPGDVRVNTALGINYFKKARFAEAEQLFRTALERLTGKYTTPKDAEATYYLGLTLKAEGKYDEAYETLYKSTWNMAWRAAGYYEAAELASRRGELAAALDLAGRSLEANALNVRALTLKAAMLRNLGRVGEALAVLAAARRIADPLDVRIMAEQWLATRNPGDARPFTATMNTFPATAAETAGEYLNAGLWKDGTAVLSQVVSTAPDRARVSPLVYYYLAYFAGKLGQEKNAAEYYASAVKAPPDYVFPFQYEMIEVFQQAIRANPRDARAPYYLGNLLYDWQPEQALKYWQQSASLDASFPIVHRNLAVAYAHQPNGLEKAVASLEKAVSLQPRYALHFAELDALYDNTTVAPEKRLALFENNHTIVAKRDDALAREISLKVTMGKYDQAIELMTGRRFAVWEGANLNVAEDWTNAHLLRGQQRLAARRYQEALADFQVATQIPDNLPAEGRGGGGHETEASYWIGAGYEGLGNAEQAREFWTKAAGEPRPGRSGAGPLPTAGMANAAQTYYRALALRKLGQDSTAKTILQDLVKAAEQAQGQPQPSSPSAPFANTPAQRSRLVMAYYAAGLAHLGLGETEQARQELNQALVINPAHVGARTALARIIE
jgi:tetratricopeptide (TPR) repeat protein